MNSEKTKVLFIGPKPPPYSGPELSMDLFLHSRLMDKYSIVFIKTNLRKSNKDKGKLDIISVFSFLCFFTKLFYTLTIHRPSVVYYPVTATQTGWIGRDAPCLIFCKLFGAKTIIHMRGSHLNLNFLTFHPIVQRLARFACRNVAVGIVQGECLRDQFDTLLPPDRIRVLYQAIDTTVYDNSDAICSTGTDILFMGQLTQAKGYCDLLRCIPAVAEAFPQVRFLVAGTKMEGERNIFFDQTTGDRLIHQEPKELESSICSGQFKTNYRYLGIISGNEKREWMRQSAVFVLPSYSEGFSRALLEAMSLGLPIICTPVGAHAEVIQEGVNGYFVAPGDVTALSQIIIKVLQEPDVRRQFAQTNYEYARCRFDIVRIAKEFSAIIDQVIANNV